MKRLTLSATLAVGMATGAMAAPIDADLMFVIDQSGSMSAEFSNLGAGIDTFVNKLEADARIGSVRVGLVRYTTLPELSINLTDDLSVFAGLRRNAGSGTENALSAIDFAITNMDISYRANAVKSVILVTDEDADDAASYTNAFGTGAAALSKLLDQTGFLNNIIHDLSDNAPEFAETARPNGALFDLDDFRADPDSFLTAFADAKLQEIIDVGTPPTGAVPLPAGAPLLLAAIGGFAFLRRRQNKATA